MRRRRTPLVEAIVGLPFYTPEEFRKQMQCADDDLGYESYDQWARAHAQLKQRLQELGITVIEVPVDVAEMQQYFLEHGLRNDAANRSQYVARKLFEQREAAPLHKKLA